MKKHNNNHKQKFNNDKQKQVKKNNQAKLVTDLKFLWNTEWYKISLSGRLVVDMDMWDVEPFDYVIL